MEVGGRTAREINLLRVKRVCEKLPRGCRSAGRVLWVVVWEESVNNECEGGMFCYTEGLHLDGRLCNEMFCHTVGNNSDFRCTEEL